MAQHRNRRVILKTRATGLPAPELFDMVEDDAPEPGDGEALIHNIYVTADPGMKGWISTAVNYASVETGATMNSFGVGVVVQSRNPDFAEGDYIVAQTGWQEYSIVSPSKAACARSIPRRAAVGVARRAWPQRLDRLFRPARCRPAERRRDRAGLDRRRSVGSAAGQFAKIKGCRTGRHRRRPGESGVVPRCVRLRRRHRL